MNDISLKDFLKFLRPLNKIVKDNTIDLRGCDVVGVAPIKYFNSNRMLHRVLVNTETGNVSVWKTSTQSYPNKKFKKLIGNE